MLFQNFDINYFEFLIDFKAIPTTEKLGGNVGRYKISIGNARKRKPTSRRPSSVIVKREFDMFSDQSMDSNEDKNKVQ